MVDVPTLQKQVKDLRKKDPEAAKKLQKQLKKKITRQNAKTESLSTSHLTLAAQQYKAGLLIPSVKVENESGATTKGPVEYITPSIDATLESFEDELPLDTVDEFRDVMKRFTEMEQLAQADGEDGSAANALSLRQQMMDDDDDDQDDEDDHDDDDRGKKDDSGEAQTHGVPTLTRKQKKRLIRPTVASLKQASRRPDLVEVWDTTGPDAYLLVYLKAYRNTVPVPAHWSHKRRYMQGKRGVEKPPFQLPPYIEQTKISEIRQSLQEKEAQKSLKQKQREKVRPKSHKMDIDYKVLQDAFFKYATKPTLTKFGDVYYEGREYEIKMRQFKPGQISDRLKEALGITGTGPPPWLLNMQRYGPPPNYPKVRIPGLNAPLPPGCEYGYHNGGWGKPPVDDYGAPLYGTFDNEEIVTLQNIDTTLWGEIPKSLSDDDMDEDDEDEDERAADEGGMKTPAGTSVAGTATPFMGGMQSITTGMDTPLTDIRNRMTPMTNTPGGMATPQVATGSGFTVLHQQKAPAQPGALFQSSTIYKMPTQVTGGAVTPLIPGGLQTPLGIGGGTMTPLPGGMQTPSNVIALDPSEIEKEPAFVADVIRAQLKQHEEAARKAHKTAHQTTDGFESSAIASTGGDVSTTPLVDGAKSATTVKGGSSSTATGPPVVEKKKKKKVFKF